MEKPYLTFENKHIEIGQDTEVKKKRRHIASRSIHFLIEKKLNNFFSPTFLCDKPNQTD